MNRNHKRACVLKALASGACFLAALTSPISTANSQTSPVILEAQIYLRFGSPFFPFPWVLVPPPVRAVPRIPAPRYQYPVAPLAAHVYICTPQLGSAMKGVVETDLFYDGRHWSITHHLSSGDVAVRNDQYAVRDSTADGEGRWEGNLRKNPRLHMVGRFNGWTYVEERYEGKQIVMRAVEDCHTAVAAAPAPAASAPAPGAEAPAPAPAPPPAYAEPAPSLPAVVAPAAPDFTDSDLQRIHAEYKANQARWSREFSGKTFAATMPIASVENDLFDHNYIRVSFMEKAGDWWPGVSCNNIAPSDLLLQRDKGDSIFVRGVIKDASLGTIDLENCEFSMKDPAAAASPPQRTPVERERGCAVCVPDEPLTKPAPPSVPETPSPPQPPPEALPGSMPSAEQALVSAVQAARQAYESATNDLLKGTARVQRGKGICQAIPDRRAIHWVGKVSELSSNGEGKGVLAIEIAEGIHAKTWNNALSDMLDDTLIGPYSPVFQQVQSLTVGARVQFSGVFPASDTDCIRESSLTLGGSISEPDFIIKFTEIVPMEPTNNAVVGPMPAENNPPMVKATVDPNMTNAKRDALVARGCNFFLDGSYVCAQEATLPPDLAPNSGLKPPAVSNDSSVRGDQLGVNAPPVDAPIPPSRPKPRSAPEHAPPDPTASGLY